MPTSVEHTRLDCTRLAAVEHLRQHLMSYANLNPNAHVVVGYKPRTIEIDSWSWDGSGGSHRSTPSGGGPGKVNDVGLLQIRQGKVEIARWLLERMLRDASMGFGLSDTDLRELLSMTDPSP
jgi:hypothetical protein